MVDEGIVDVKLKHGSVRGLAATLIAVAVVSVLRAQDVPAPDNHPDIEHAYTVPSEKTNLSFTDAGIVDQVLVKDGDRVRVGEVLATEQTDEELIQYKSMKIVADSTSDIDAAKADRDAKKLHYDSLQQAGADQGANGQEVQEAKLAYDQAEILIKKAEQEHAKNQADLEKEFLKIAHMKLTSPFDGVVSAINIHPGEMADPGKPDGVITVVQNRPLWVELQLKSNDAAKLKLGQELPVVYDNTPDQTLTASVIFIDPVVDASSDNQLIRLELSNNDEKAAGMSVTVKMPWAAQP